MSHRPRVFFELCLLFVVLTMIAWALLLLAGKVAM